MIAYVLFVLYATPYTFAAYKLHATRLHYYCLTDKRVRDNLA